MLNSRLTLAALLALTTMAAPVSAKKGEAPATEQGGSKADAKNISKPVRPFLTQAQKLEAAGDSAGALAQIRSAEATGSLNPTDIFYISQIKLGLGNKLKDNTVLEEAIKASASSEFLPATEKPKYLRNLAAIAFQRNDYAAATTYYEQVGALTPNDVDVWANLSVLYSRQKQNPQAIAALQKAIAASKASGKSADENLYRNALKIAVDAKLPELINAASVDLVTAYPTPVNWRDALLIYRDSAKPKLDDQANLDVFRLMDAAGALNGERDYAEYVETAIGKGLFGEAKSVLGEGVANKMLVTTKPYIADFNRSITTRTGPDRAALPGLDKEARTSTTGKTALGQGDAYSGYGDYAKAVEMYRLALSKGGVDASTANLRLGAALARSGDKAGATSALQPVKGAPRETLARYWMIWLGKKA